MAVSIRPDEIAGILQTHIEQYEDKITETNVGTVLEVSDGIARIYGLSDAMMSELIEFPNGTMGMVMNLEEDKATGSGAPAASSTSPWGRPSWEESWTLWAIPLTERGRWSPKKEETWRPRLPAS